MNDYEMPQAPTRDTMLEDLRYAVEAGTPWFDNEVNPSDPSAILVTLYDDEGRIAKTFTVELSIKEN